MSILQSQSSLPPPDPLFQWQRDPAGRSLYPPIHGQQAGVPHFHWDGVSGPERRTELAPQLKAQDGVIQCSAFTECLPESSINQTYSQLVIQLPHVKGECLLNGNIK